METDRFLMPRILWSSGLAAAGGLCLGGGGAGGSTTLVTVIPPGNTGGCCILWDLDLALPPGVAGFLLAGGVGVFI